MSSPLACSARIADSRPAPGPVTRTSTERTPFSLACSAQLAAASWAANGVPLREPLNPMRPADDQARTPPSWSAIVMIVLLNEACTVAIACGMFFFSFLPVRARFPFPLAGFSGTAAAAVASAILFPQVLRFPFSALRSEEHTSELQSQSNLVCRLLLEKKNKTNTLTRYGDYHRGSNSRHRSAAPTPWTALTEGSPVSPYDASQQ